MRGRLARARRAYDRAAVSAAERASEVFAPGVLAGAAALVTGGGTGLGRASALELARCGARVAVCGRRPEPLAETVAEIEALGGAASAIGGDVRDAAEAERLIGAVLEAHGGLDVLVNNAGGQFFSPAELIAAKGWH